ncbi:MAG: phosphoribosylanthranilate isomerase [Beijerinckiaceae bacterium]|nr:phosphoribosylanthranilate isomerase [Beijerinckiaceae bacterium]
MSVFVKICGLATERALDAALKHGADMTGFVFFEKSPRHVSLELAAHLGERAGTRTRKVLLTVDADDAVLAAAIGALKPAILQLHGSESPERVALVRARFGLPIIKAIGIAEAADLALLPPYETAADLLLFDAKPTRAASRPGGTGTSFDWSLLAGIETNIPWLLAGGLDAGNVGEALAVTHAPGIDVSSGVESAPGVKDPSKIAAFIAKVREAAERLGAPSETS